MGFTIIQGSEAWKSVLKNDFSRWSHDLDRIKHDFANIHHQPKFELSSSDSFFCMGSCFARNIEEHLIYRNVSVLSKAVISPKIECSTRINGFLNKFAAHSMVNELEWVLCEPVIDELFFDESSEGWHDLQLAPGISSVSLDRAVERRKYLLSEYFSRISTASVIVLTLGLNEVWFDNNSMCYLNCAPGYYAVRREVNRYDLHVTNADQNIVELERIWVIMQEINPDARIIITVSPVPMSDTFSGRDVLAANIYSKSTLRVAAETFAMRHENVDYFPSYDMVMMTRREIAFASDFLHVSDRIVGRVMSEFFRLYLKSEIEPVQFTELGYLAANPDVEDAVRLTTFSSGFEHWQLHGKAEGRLLTPEGGPTELMIAAGAV